MRNRTHDPCSAFLARLFIRFFVSREMWRLQLMGDN